MHEKLVDQFKRRNSPALYLPRVAGFIKTTPIGPDLPFHPVIKNENFDYFRYAWAQHYKQQRPMYFTQKSRYSNANHHWKPNHSPFGEGWVENPDFELCYAKATSFMEKLNFKKYFGKYDLKASKITGIMYSDAVKLLKRWHQLNKKEKRSKGDDREMEIIVSQFKQNRLAVEPERFVTQTAYDERLGQMRSYTIDTESDEGIYADIDGKHPEKYSMADMKVMSHYWHGFPDCEKFDWTLEFIHELSKTTSANPTRIDGSPLTQEQSTYDEWKEAMKSRTALDSIFTKCAIGKNSNYFQQKSNGQMVPTISDSNAGTTNENRDIDMAGTCDDPKDDTTSATG